MRFASETPLPLRGLPAAHDESFPTTRRRSEGVMTS